MKHGGRSTAGCPSGMHLARRPMWLLARLPRLPSPTQTMCAILVDVDLEGTSLTALASRQVRVASAPLATVTELVIEGLGRSMGSPASWPGAVRAALEACDLALLDAVYGSREQLVVPDALLPRPSGFASSMSDDLERIWARSTDELVDEIESEGLDGPGWRAAAREPRRWLGAYLRAMQRAWSAAAPLWAQATPLLERETERVAVAMARGALDQVLDGLPNGHVTQDRWFVWHDGRPATIADDLVLVPMVIGPKARLVGTANGKVVDVAYAVPGADRVFGYDGVGAAGSGLDALVGAPRAEILRRLDRAVPAGALAEQLQLGPSGVTHHLAALERAGLVRRERVGRRVFVHRSSRGSALLHLYER
jgi:DNA-binding transcriptional ArsR family regulator